MVLGVLCAASMFWAGAMYGQRQAQTARFGARFDGAPINLTVEAQTPVGKIVRRATDQLYKDERARSNLTDDEARVVLDWAARWIEEQALAAPDEASAESAAQQALARVRPVIRALNTLAAQPDELRFADALNALEPSLQVSRSMRRAPLFQVLTALTSAVWKIQSDPVQQNP